MDTRYLNFLLPLKFLMKTLIEPNRAVWAKVKEFATLSDLSVNSAVEVLLTEALSRRGYSVPPVSASLHKGDNEK